MPNINRGHENFICIVGKVLYQFESRKLFSLNDLEQFKYFKLVNLVLNSQPIWTKVDEVGYALTQRTPLFDYLPL
jgi:hypothetical protein